MDWLVYIGFFVGSVGLSGILYCLLSAIRYRRSEASDTALRGKLTKLLPVNLGSVLIAAIGLMLVVIGMLF